MFVLSDELSDEDFADEVKRIFAELAIRLRQNDPTWTLDQIIKDTGLNDPSMVYAGEQVVCEGNGHLICTVMENIGTGEANWTRKLGKWQMEPPERGSQPVCDICGGKWWNSPFALKKGTLHIKDRGWVTKHHNVLPGGKALQYEGNIVVRAIKGLLGV